MKHAAAGFVLLALLAGCAAPKTTYLTLAPVPGPTAATVSPPLGIARVRMPAAIDRLYLTSATGPSTMAVADHARWVAPLGGQAQSVLAADLAQRLPDTTVLRPGDPAPHGGERMVSVNVTRFLPASGLVELDAGWRIMSRHHHRSIGQGRATIRVPSGATPAGEAQAMSVALGQLADRIAAHLTP
jgi:Uncharacterized protein conserved in bacteria